MKTDLKPAYAPGAKTRAHRYLGRRLSVAVLGVISAMVVIGPTGSAEALTSTPRTNTVSEAAAPTGGVTLQTEEPELTEMDRVLLINVRLAGLWEIPAGQMAMTKGASPRVRQIGQMIASQHVRLDTLDKTAAKAVGVELPDKPTGQQLRWLHEMENAEGSTFDTIYVMRLRAAHGKIFPAIGAVRASTHSDVVRDLAQSANNFVLTHISLLESTGLVRYDDLAKAEAPAMDPPSATTDRNRSGDLPGPMIWIILATALIAGAIVTARMIRPLNSDDGRGGRRRAITEEPITTGRAPVRSTTGSYPPPGLRLNGGTRSLP